MGGANLKAADGRGFALSRRFPLWRQPAHLREALRGLLAASPPAGLVAVTMTGELADCFATRQEGVAAIVSAAVEAAAPRDVLVYLTDGSLVAPDEAVARPLAAAAANWRALSDFACRYLADGAGLLLDVGSTTCDVVPLAAAGPLPQGRTDLERLLCGELVYTGVERTPVCAVVRELPWRGMACPVAAELFATTGDAYLTLGDLPEEPESLHTADGRPATRPAAWARLARSICADTILFTQADAHAAAAAIAQAQLHLLVAAARRVAARLPPGELTAVVCGQGDFLARRALPLSGRHVARVILLKEELGEAASRCAPAHALAVLARERLA